MRKNNLFAFATSELSQDAFICWLLNFAHIDHMDEDRILTSCAKEFLSQIIENGGDLVVTKIQRQFKNIDILVEVNNKYNILIEDKTYTGQHHGQIARYRDQLIKEGFTNVICVYFKIVEQAYKEAGAINIDRTGLLNIFGKYIHKTQNSIFGDYYDHLKYIDNDANGYKNTPIKEWRKLFNHAYKGFFTHLINDQKIDCSRSYDWRYVANQSNGFWGLHWYGLRREELSACNLLEPDIKELYLQIEDDEIAVKMTGTGELTTNIRWDLYSYFKNKITDFEKKAFRQGCWMTVGYIKYDESNYEKRIVQMQEVMKSISQGDYQFDGK